MKIELTEKEKAQGFQEREWKPGVSQYCCNHCPWDTLRADAIKPHLLAAHNFFQNWVEVEVERPLEATLLDSAGQVIQTVSEKQIIPDIQGA